MLVYVIVCAETLKIYIGQHKDDDLGKYLSKKFYDAFRYVRGMSHLYAAMRKHPRETWSIHPLASTADKAELDALERHYIRVLKAQHPDVGYNICDGGEGYTGPGYWLGKKRPGFTIPKRPGWRNQTTFSTGHPATRGSSGLPSFRKGQKMQYASDDTRNRALRGLKRGFPKGAVRSAAFKEKCKQAHQHCACPKHVLGRQRTASGS